MKMAIFTKEVKWVLMCAKATSRLYNGPLETQPVSLTQFGTAVVVDDPGEHRVLGQVAAAAVGQVVEVQQVLGVGEEAALPLQHVALGRALRGMVLCRDQTCSHLRVRLN